MHRCVHYEEKQKFPSFNFSAQPIIISITMSLCSWHALVHMQYQFHSFQYATLCYTNEEENPRTN